jgi:hypothetical protein
MIRRVNECLGKTGLFHKNESGPPIPSTPMPPQEAVMGKVDLQCFDVNGCK